MKREGAYSQEAVSKKEVSLTEQLATAGDKELVGTLRGFDVFVNMVLEDVDSYENSVDGVTVTHLDQILLNGNNIALLVPGGKPDTEEE